MSRPISKDWVEAYFENGVDVANRRVFIWGDIDEESIGNAVKGICLLDSKDSSKTIELFVSSEGGEIQEAFGLYDVIQTITCPISTFAVGKCMSVAPLLVACGAKGDRWTGPNCSFMIHQPSQEFDGEGGGRRIDELRKELIASENIRGQWADLMAKHTGKPRSFWLKECGKIGDSHFNAQTAVDYGIVDNIWVERSDD
jgi:ATP-dependent Clp protease protease subunit